MTRWLRREAIAILLAVVLGAAAVAVTLRLDWFPYRESQPVQVTRVAQGESAGLGGTQFSVTGVRVVAGDSAHGERWEVAPDARLVIVSLQVRPGAGDGPAGCTLRLVAPGSPDTRWDTAGFSETSYSPPDRFVSHCDGEATEPYALQAVYVVPAAQPMGHLELEVTDLRLLPQALRLELGAATEPPR